GSREAAGGPRRPRVERQALVVELRAAPGERLEVPRLRQAEDAVGDALLRLVADDGGDRPRLVVQQVALRAEGLDAHETHREGDGCREDHHDAAQRKAAPEGPPGPRPLAVHRPAATLYPVPQTVVMGQASPSLRRSWRTWTSIVRLSPRKV